VRKDKYEWRNTKKIMLNKSRRSDPVRKGFLRRARPRHRHASRSTLIRMRGLLTLHLPSAIPKYSLTFIVCLPYVDGHQIQKMLCLQLCAELTKPVDGRLGRISYMHDSVSARLLLSSLILIGDGSFRFQVPMNLVEIIFTERRSKNIPCEECRRSLYIL
jgi:hypothetical protein